AFQVALILSSRDTASEFKNMFPGLAPARRDLLASFSVSDPFSAVSYQSALISRAWIDPNYVQTRSIFANMSQETLLRIKSSERSIIDSNEQINVLFNIR